MDKKAFIGLIILVALSFVCIAVLILKPKKETNQTSIKYPELEEFEKMPIEEVNFNLKELVNEWKLYTSSLEKDSVLNIYWNTKPEDQIVKDTITGKNVKIKIHKPVDRKEIYVKEQPSIDGYFKHLYNKRKPK